MKTQTTHFFGKLAIKAFLNPSRSLSETEFWELYKGLLFVNQNRQQPIDHKLLQPMQSNMEFIKNAYASTVLTVAYYEKQPIGFLISPIVPIDGSQFAHSGLVIISHNPGVDILGLLSLAMVVKVYQNYGKSYFTNISSTPSIIEAFGKTMKPNHTWPDPHAKLVKPPQKYKEIYMALYEKYITNFFPNPQSIVLDKRRFTIHSESQAMGFNTNFRELSRSTEFIYLNFCFTWLDYEKEEDMVQVGYFTFREAMRARLMLMVAKFLLRKKNLKLKEVQEEASAPKNAEPKLKEGGSK